MQFFRYKGLSKAKYSREFQELKRDIAFIKNALNDPAQTILSPHTGNLMKINPYDCLLASNIL